MSNPMQQGMAAAPAPANAPSQAELDKQRVTLILEINSQLLEQIQALQAAGKGGDVQSPAQNNAADGAEAQQQPKKPAREYVESLRRMQANLAYLASVAERHQKPNAQTPPWPQVMSAPPGDERLAAMYSRLQALFPQWRVQQQRMAAAQAAQAQQAAGGAGAMQTTSIPMAGGQNPGMVGMQQNSGMNEQGNMG